MINRRQILRSSAALGALAGLGWPATLRAAPSDRRFIFIVNFGGWDVTRVLAPQFSSPRVAMEADAVEASFGNLRFVDHPERPMVRSFFEHNYRRMALLHGILVPSVAHMSCLQLLLTGRISGRPDWPAILAAAGGADFALPQLVLSGPSYPGVYGGSVTRAGGSGQLEALIEGDIADWLDTPTPKVEPLIELAEARALASRMDRAVLSAADARALELLQTHQRSVQRADALKEVSEQVSWSSGGDFTGDCLLAVDTLARGLASCVTLTFSHDWDTHADNDIWQNWHWSGLFDGLDALMEALDQEPGAGGGSLADETTVVVLSEMGRTPGLNAEEGKDHWPYTSAMLLGSGFQGDRSVGGYDDSFYGLPIDPISGDSSAGGEDFTCDRLGATLLAIADVDPAEHLPNTSPIAAVL